MPPHIVTTSWNPPPALATCLSFTSLLFQLDRNPSSLDSRALPLLSWCGFCLFFWAWYFYNHFDNHAFSFQPSSSPSYGIPWGHLPSPFVRLGQENRTCIDLLQTSYLVGAVQSSTCHIPVHLLWTVLCSTALYMSGGLFKGFLKIYILLLLFRSCYSLSKF